MQMSNAWIQNVINRMKESTRPQHIQDLGNDLQLFLDGSPEKIEKFLTAVDIHTGEFNVIKLGDF